MYHIPRMQVPDKLSYVIALPNALYSFHNKRGSVGPDLEHSISCHQETLSGFRVLVDASSCYHSCQKLILAARSFQDVRNLEYPALAPTRYSLEANFMQAFHNTSMRNVLAHISNLQKFATDNNEHMKESQYKLSLIHI